MFKILKLYSFTFLFLFSSLFAELSLGLDRYFLTVTAVDPVSQSYVLSNQMVFHLAKERWGHEQLPLIGAEVWLNPRFLDTEPSSVQEKGDFEVSYVYPFQMKKSSVWMSEESKKHCLSYVATKSVCIQPAGWFSSGVYVDVIELSDGSEWVVQTEDPISFKKGDHIVLVQADHEHWWIINIDQKWFTMRNGKYFTCSQTKGVKPYMFSN